MYTANSRLTHEKALCEWFRNLSKRNVVRATAAIVELNSDWLNRFTRTRGSGLGHPHWVIAKHSKYDSILTNPGQGDRDWERSRPNQMAAKICASGQRRFAELFLLKLIKWTVTFFFNAFYRCRGNTLTMCKFHESACNGFGDIWWTDNPIYYSSIDINIINRDMPISARHLQSNGGILKHHFNGSRQSVGSDSRKVSFCRHDAALPEVAFVTLLTSSSFFSKNAWIGWADLIIEAYIGVLLSIYLTAAL